jgi:hypothetical protein
MRFIQLVTVAFALTTSACASSVNVRTQVAPDASFAGRRTFSILPVPPRSVDAASAASDDPMLANSITNRALVDDLTRAFEARGYVLSTTNPDFTVAYYASTRERLDINTWNYGYSWRRWPRRYVDVTEYTEGTVIVDVIEPSTKELLWRGQGVSAVSDDPAIYTRELDKTVTAILNKFPQASSQTASAFDNWSTASEFLSASWHSGGTADGRRRPQYFKSEKRPQMNANERRYSTARGDLHAR